MADDGTGHGRSLEQRVSGLEARMDDAERMTDDTRQLAAFVDRDQHRMERKLDLALGKVGDLEHNVGVLKQDVGVLKQDVGVLKQDVGELQRSVDLNRQMLNAHAEQTAHAFAGVRGQLDRLAAGQETIVNLITRSMGDHGGQ